MITQAEQHLSEGEVIRALDQQLESDERGRVHDHLQNCAICREQVNRAQRRKTRLSELLVATDFAVLAAAAPIATNRVIDLNAARARRTQGWQQPWLRAAAAIVLLLGVAMTISPVRAAVVHWIRGQWERITQSDRPAVQPTTPAPAPAAPLGPSIDFAHEAREFVLQFTNAQSSGSVNVRYDASDRVHAETSSPAAELLVLPTGLRVNNRDAGNANYTLLLPRSVTSVVIKVGDATVATLLRAQLQTGTDVPLSVR